ncbi:hypothetical protein CYMTET_8772 [Cymbomonas tetramitiformis]|uniref:Uncharacterized protein n=1 Tax=Cymbomonas tetramitiformis TaxID=36881 RepID=A0AAE0GSF3_9CHLO|nr:hypothetical protein CYMTET_8772 [Cymbomonas tetramitiformis]
MGVTTRAKKSLTRDNDIDASLRLIDGVRNSPTVRAPIVPTPNPASNEDADVATRRYLQEQWKLTDEIYKARLHRACSGAFGNVSRGQIIISLLHRENVTQSCFGEFGERNKIFYEYCHVCSKSFISYEALQIRFARQIAAFRTFLTVGSVFFNLQLSNRDTYDMPKRKFKYEEFNDFEMHALHAEQRSQRRTRVAHEASFLNKPSALHECVEVEFLPAIKPIDKEWTKKVFDDVHADKSAREKRIVVPKEQVALLVDSFNPKNFMAEKKTKSRTFVDLVAAEHCKDFCAFLVPEMWLADRAYPLRRMWWAKKREEKLIYELEGVRGMRWIVCVKEKRKGNDLFAKTSVKLSAKPGLQKGYAERKKAAQESASSNGEDALEDALRNDVHRC